jgi:hypothetical protein
MIFPYFCLIRRAGMRLGIVFRRGKNVADTRRPSFALGRGCHDANAFEMKRFSDARAQGNDILRRENSADGWIVSGAPI